MIAAMWIERGKEAPGGSLGSDVEVAAHDPLAAWPHAVRRAPSSPFMMHRWHCRDLTG
jgi:hypothetical protein